MIPSPSDLASLASRLVAGRPHAAPSDADQSPVEWALRDVGLQFGDDINIDLEESPSLLDPWTRCATCTSLGETVAVLIAPLDQWTDEPDNVAVHFRQHPKLTAVVLVSIGRRSGPW